MPIRFAGAQNFGLLAMRNSAARLSLLLILPLLALTACQTDSTGAPKAQAAPPTHEEAALQCWMTVEKEHQSLSLDKRADIVTKCIHDKMNPGQATAASAAKPAAKPPPKPPKSKT
jgi:hypothetical protein